MQLGWLVQEVQDSMRMVDDGPLRRALTAKWLLFDEQALRHPHMFSHINALLRDFALGDSLGRLAAAEALLDIFADIDSPLEVLRDHSQVLGLICQQLCRRCCGCNVSNRL